MAASTVQSGVTWKTILIIALLIGSLAILAALPLSFFFNGNMGNWFGNIPLGLVPPPLTPPPPMDLDDWEIPEGFTLPEGWEDWELPPGFELPDGFNGTLPPGEIPWWMIAGGAGYLLMNGSLPGGGGVGGDGGVGGLPGGGGSMGNGLGPFGSGSTAVYVTANQPWRYWRLGAYDYFEGTTWFIEDNTTTVYVPNNTLGTQYTVLISVTFSEAGYGTLPLPSLWNQPMIQNNFQVFPSTNVTYNLIEDAYGTVHWNASLDIPGIYAISYNVTYDPSANLSFIESNVYNNSPRTFTADPNDGHDYLQLPDMSPYPLTQQDMQAMASNPALATNDTYETARAVMEYFKTRWWWTPYRANFTSGTDYNPDYLLTNGYGISADFASNYVLYLRSLNISSRLVWGGVGYQDASPIPTMRKLTHSHLWAEVWIPNATNTGGEWVQFDPSPLPVNMWQPDQSTDPPGPLIWIDVRRNDTRVETSHYTLFFDASVPMNTPQNPGDLFDLTGSLVRDGSVLTETWLNEPVLYTYTDVTENAFVGNSTSTYPDHNFTASAPAGPHRFNASFHAVVNETVVTCNGTTAVTIRSLNPTLIFRGSGDAFIVDANISDGNGNFVSDVELRGYVIEIDQNLTDNYGRQLTDQIGNVTSSYSFPSSQPEGIYNFTMIFDGTFVVNYPEPYPDFNITVPGSGSQSQNETITVYIIPYLNLTSQTNVILPRGYTEEFSGYLTYDNNSGISGGVVSVWWKNSTGTFNICAAVTDGSGFYQAYYYIPANYDDSVDNNNVSIWANVTSPIGVGNTTPTSYHIGCSNYTNITLNTDLGSYQYITRYITSINVWGTLSDPQGVASTAGQEVWILLYETMQPLTMVPLITDANGDYSGTVQVFNSATGPYNLSAGFAGNWTFYGDTEPIPSSMSISERNASTEMVVVATTVLSKTSGNPFDIGRVVTPVPMIAGDPVNIEGYLLFENTSGFGSQLVRTWWIEQDGTETDIGNDTTQADGYYNITYDVPLSQPTDIIIKVNYSAGSLLTSYILNASADQDPPIYWAVNVSINSVTPGEALRGQTTVQVSGRVIEKHGQLVANELIYLTFGGTNVLDEFGSPVTATTDGNGYFTANFRVSPGFPISTLYDVNVTLTNSSFLYNLGTTGSIEVNTTTSILNLAVDKTAMRGENITLSGRLVDNLGQDLSGEVKLLVNGSAVYNATVTGAFNWQFPVPDNSTVVGWNNLTLLHEGTVITYPSLTQGMYRIPKGATLQITNVGGYSPIGNLTLNAGTQITITGTLTDNETSTPFYNRQVTIYYNGTALGSGMTDASGNYAIQITLPAVAGNATLWANFTGYGAYISQVIIINAVIPPGIGDFLLQFLPWIIGIVVGVVAAYLGYRFYSRRGIKEKAAKLLKFGGIDINFVQNKITALQEGKRYREAIIYIYYIYLKLMRDYFNIPRKPSQTVREYAMKTVKRIKLSPTIIYPFTSLYENARFGKKPIDETQCNEAIKLFLNLQTQIMEIPRAIAMEQSSKPIGD